MEEEEDSTNEESAVVEEAVNLWQHQQQPLLRVHSSCDTLRMFCCKQLTICMY